VFGTTNNANVSNTSGRALLCGASGNAYSTSMSPLSQTICNDVAAGTITHAVGSTIGTRQWQTSSTGPGWGYSDISGATGATYTPPATSGNRWYRVYYTISGCATQYLGLNMYSQPAEVIDPTITPNAGNDFSLSPSTPSANLAANAPSSGTGTWSIVSGPSISLNQFGGINSATSSFTPYKTGTYVLRWTHSCGNQYDDVQVTVSGSASTTWTGGISTDWHTGSNWSNGVPNQLTDATIPTGTTFAPTMNANASTKSCTINASATLTISGGNYLKVHDGALTVNGSLAGVPRFRFNGGTTSYAGTHTPTVYNIQIDNSALTFETNATLITEVSLEYTSTFDPDGAGDAKIFTLESTNDKPDASARIAAIPSGSSITGKIRFKRYHNFTDLSYDNDEDGYVHFSSPVQNAPVSDFQGEVWVTGEFTGNCCGNKYPSMWSWTEGTLTDATYPNCRLCSYGWYEGVYYANIDDDTVSLEDSWLPFPYPAAGQTNTATFTAGKGYGYWQWLPASLKGGTATWNLNGVPNQGSVVVPITYTNTSLTKKANIFSYNTPSENGWNLIGNPYASAIDWESDGITNWDVTTGTIYVADFSIDMDPANPTFRIYNRNTGTSTNGGSRYIAAGQAFWVMYDHDGTGLSANQQVSANLTFTEDAKVPNNSNVIFASNNLNYLSYMTPPPSLKRIQLKLNGLNAAGLNAEREVVIAFKSNATMGLDRKFDVTDKWTNINVNSNFNLTTQKNGLRYCHNIIPLDSIKNAKIDVLTLGIADSTYTLNWDNYDLDDYDVRVRLYDSQTGKYINMKTNDSYTFVAVANSTTPRFKIIFDEIPAPQVLGYTKGSDASASTTHTGTFPTGIKRGELLVFIANSRGSTPSVPSDAGNNDKKWRGFNRTTGGLYTRVAFKYADGEEFDPQELNGSFSYTTSTSNKCTWVMLRLSKDAVPVFNRTTSGNSSSASSLENYKNGNDYNKALILDILQMLSDAQPTSNVNNYSTVTSQTGADSDGVSAWIGQKTILTTPSLAETRSAIPLSETTDYVNRTFSFVFPKAAASDLHTPIFDFEYTSSGYDVLSASTNKGVAQSFKGNGEDLKSIIVTMRRTNSVSGTMVLKLYDHSGTFGTSSVPTGSALATSSLSVSASSLSTGAWQSEEFVFSTPYTLEMGKPYVFTIECSDISGAGTIGIQQSASTSLSGNCAQSTNLSTWTNTSVSDLTYFINTVKGSADYKWNTDFTRESITGNTTLVGFETIDQLLENSGVGLSGGSATYVENSIENDSGLGKNVFRTKLIDDNPNTSDMERTYLSLRPFAGAEQPTVLHTQTKMKFDADVQHMEQYSSAIPSSGAYYTIYEHWLQDDPAMDGSTTASARYGLELRKASGTSQALYWALKSEYLQPDSLSYDDIWTTSYTNTSISVPYNQWFILDWYQLKGNNSTGRLIVKIKVGTGSWQTLFDITDYTEYPNKANLETISIHAIRHSAGDTLLDFMRNASKKVEIKYSEIYWLKD